MPVLLLQYIDSSQVHVVFEDVKGWCWAGHKFVDVSCTMYMYMKLDNDLIHTADTSQICIMTVGQLRMVWQACSYGRRP